MNNSFIAFIRHIWATKNRLTNYPGTGMDFRSGGFGGTIMPFDIYTPSTIHSPYFLKKKMTDDSGASEKEGHGLDENTKTNEKIIDDPSEETEKNGGCCNDNDKEPILEEPDGTKKGTVGHLLNDEKDGIGSSLKNKVAIERQSGGMEIEEKEGGNKASLDTSLEKNRNSVSEVEESLLHPIKVDKVQLLALKRKGENEKMEKSEETAQKFKKKKNHKFNIV